MGCRIGAVAKADLSVSSYHLPRNLRGDEEVVRARLTAGASCLMVGCSTVSAEWSSDLQPKTAGWGRMIFQHRWQTGRFSTEQRQSTGQMAE